MGNAKIKITVIVTIHNAEAYIRECLDSVLGQAFSDIEILCMDGGSTDRTPEILKEYAGADSRIRIVNDPNTSYGHKVNRGIEEAQGEYISVLESDDMYEPFMLEKLYEAAERYHPDFVNGSYTNFFDVEGYRFGYVTGMYQKEDYNCIINYKRHPERFGSIPRYWTGIFKKDFLQKESIRMNESPGASYQDMSFRFLTSILAEKAYHLELPVYLYRIDNPGSSMYDSKKTVVIADEHEFLKSELIKRGITDRRIWHNALQWKYVDFRGNMRHLKGKYREELFDRYREELEKDRDALAAYCDLGYSQFAGGMIYETPQRVMELLEQDEMIEAEERKRLYRLPEIVLGMKREQKIVIFGCGQRGTALLGQLRFERELVGCLTDNSKVLWNTTMHGYMVLSPEDAVCRYPDALFIVANKFHAEDIARQLRQMGIEENKICVY